MAYNDHDADDRKRMPKTGSLKARAKRAGQSKEAFAQANIHTDSPVGKLARLAHLQMGAHGGGKSRMDGAGDARSPGAKLYQVG